MPAKKASNLTKSGKWIIVIILTVLLCFCFSQRFASAKDLEIQTKKTPSNEKKAMNELLAIKQKADDANFRIITSIKAANYFKHCREGLKHYLRCWKVCEKYNYDKKGSSGAKLCSACLNSIGLWYALLEQNNHAKSYNYHRKALNLDPENITARENIDGMIWNIITLQKFSINTHYNSINGIATYDCGSCIITFTGNNPQKIQAPFSTSLNKHITTILKQRGYNSITTGLDISVAFVKYIKTRIEVLRKDYFEIKLNDGKPFADENYKYVYTTAMLSNIVNDAKILSFSLLVDSFIDDIVLKK